MTIGFISSMNSGLLANISSSCQSQSQGNNPMQQKVNSAVAKLLGISTSTLSSDLSSGQTLKGIAAKQGVSADSRVGSTRQQLPIT